MDSKEKILTAAAFAFAMFSQLFLVNVVNTNASFQRADPARDYLAPSQIISARFDNELNIIASNLRWSVSTSAQAAKEPVLAFFGLNDYAYGQPRYTSVASRTQSQVQPQVLGTFQINPLYSQ